MNLFRVVRDHGDELRHRLVLTPFSRAEFQRSYEESDDPIEQARRTVIRSFQGVGSGAATGRKTGFRANSNGSNTTGANDWRHYPEALTAIIERLRGVVIEQRPACEVMKRQDSKRTLHYVDPPYVHATRNGRKGGKAKVYRFEMSDEEHRELADVLHRLKSGVILSGYHCPLYDELYDGWRRVEKSSRVDGGGVRTEVLWCHNVPDTTPDLFLTT